MFSPAGLLLLLLLAADDGDLFGLLHDRITATTTAVLLPIASFKLVHNDFTSDQRRNRFSVPFLASRGLPILRSLRRRGR